MSPYHQVQVIQINRENLLITIDGRNYTFKIKDISKRLSGASQSEIEKYEISPSGYGIHWPMIDEDLSIDCLIGVKHEHLKNLSGVSHI